MGIFMDVEIVGGSPWGFRLQGGTEFSQPLQVLKVETGGKASSAGLQAGDIVMAINDQPCSDLTHAEALKIIKSNPNIVRFLISRSLPSNDFEEIEEVEPSRPPPPVRKVTTTIKVRSVVSQRKDQTQITHFGTSEKPDSKVRSKFITEERHITATDNPKYPEPTDVIQLEEEGVFDKPGWYKELHKGNPVSSDRDYNIRKGFEQEISQKIVPEKQSDTLAVPTYLPCSYDNEQQEFSVTNTISGRLSMLLKNSSKAATSSRPLQEDLFCFESSCLRPSQAAGVGFTSVLENKLEKNNMKTSKPAAYNPALPGFYPMMFCDQIAQNQQVNQDSPYKKGTASIQDSGTKRPSEYEPRTEAIRETLDKEQLSFSDTPSQPGSYKTVAPRVHNSKVPSASSAAPPTESRGTSSIYEKSKMLSAAATEFPRYGSTPGESPQSRPVKSPSTNDPKIIGSAPADSVPMPQPKIIRDLDSDSTSGQLKASLMPKQIQASSRNCGPTGASTDRSEDARTTKSVTKPQVADAGGPASSSSTVNQTQTSGEKYASNEVSTGASLGGAFVQPPDENLRTRLYSLTPLTSHRNTSNIMRLVNQAFIMGVRSAEANRYQGADSTSVTRLVRAVYTFVAGSSIELGFKKGDVLRVTREVDDNWYEGEFDGKMGIFPKAYVQVVSSSSSLPPAIEEGEAVAKFRFSAQSPKEIPFKKGDNITLLKKIDANWYEAELNDVVGLVPAPYLQVLKEPQLIFAEDVVKLLPGSQTLPSVDQSRKSSHSTSSPTTSRRNHNTDGAVSSENPMEFRMEGERHKVIHPFTPTEEDEIELLAGDSVVVLEKCDDGWYVGISERTQNLGTFPGNFVCPME